jgi:peptidoglycan/xylan/chitin deacetylase (PgdA/CDA1 family)
MILMYHNLAAEAGFNTVAVQQFEQQMGLLKAKGYEVMGMDDYVQRIDADGRSGAKTVVITFDDAYQSFQTLALPILKKFGFPATVYVPIDFVGQASTWDAISFPIMPWKAIGAIAQEKLVTIGAHSASHQRLRGLDQHELAKELVLPKAELQKRLRMTIRHFSYPYGQLRDFSKEAKQFMVVAGYSSACSTLWSNVNKAGHWNALRRLEIEPQDDLAAFEAKISRRYHPRWWRQRAKNLLFRIGLKR